MPAPAAANCVGAEVRGRVPGTGPSPSPSVANCVQCGRSASSRSFAIHPVSRPHSPLGPRPAMPLWSIPSAAPSATVSGARSTSASSQRTASGCQDHAGDGRRSDAHADAADHGALRRSPVQGERQAGMRALSDRARQGFWNGSLPPVGFRTVAAEKRGAKPKKKLEIDPLHAETLRPIHRHALEALRHRRPDGRQAHRQPTEPQPDLHPRRRAPGMGQVHRILSRHGSRGEHTFSICAKCKVRKAEWWPRRSRRPSPLRPSTPCRPVEGTQSKVPPTRAVSGPRLPTGLIHFAGCGGAMTIRTGTGGRCRDSACSTRTRP